MILTKHKITIIVEVLDPLAAGAQIEKALTCIHNETPHGTLSDFDGDSVSWGTDTTEVTV